MTNVIAILVAVLVQVETHNHNVVGDEGRSIGVLQMKVAAVREANRIVGFNKWRDEDRWNSAKSRAMCAVTLEHHWKRGTRNAVNLAGKWRNPYSHCPAEYKQAVRKELDRRLDG